KHLLYSPRPNEHAYIIPALTIFFCICVHIFIFVFVPLTIIPLGGFFFEPFYSGTVVCGSPQYHQRVEAHPVQGGETAKGGGRGVEGGEDVRHKAQLSVYISLAKVGEELLDVVQALLLIDREVPGETGVVNRGRERWFMHSVKNSLLPIVEDKPSVIPEFLRDIFFSVRHLGDGGDKRSRCEDNVIPLG
ncbi:hypothetical protein EDB87DRAFT_1416010, partial [Lactarius vividus]